MCEFPQQGLLCRALGIAMLLTSSAIAREVPLLSPSQGQLPTDVATDDLTKLSLVERPELGGKVLKVERLSGDSFGDRIAKVTNWKQFITLKFAAVNPDKSDVRLILSVKHRRTTSYPTRVDMPFTLKPGKNSVVLGIDDMINVNGSTPDLEHVSRWYVACEADQRPSALYFGDFVLQGPDEPAAGPARAQAGPAVPYHITGKIGDMPVDLIAKPILGSSRGLSSAKVPVKTDPARLARIRAAKMPAITEPVMFDTPEADAIVSAMEILPPDNPFNQVIEDWPLIVILHGGGSGEH